MRSDSGARARARPPPGLFGGNSIQDVIGRFLRLPGGVDDKLAVVAKLLEPSRDVRRLIVEHYRCDSGFGAKVSRSHLSDHFLKRVHGRTERRPFTKPFSRKAFLTS